jgi:hypothetical protein
MMPCLCLSKGRCSIASQSGQALPLFTILLALFAALGIGITKSIRSHTLDFVDREERIQNELQRRSKEAFSLNEIANNNIRMRNLIREMLMHYELSLSRAFNLSSSTPLWEKDLPIPVPYNVFQRLDLSLPRLLSEVASIGATNALLLQNVSNELSRGLMSLSLAQSVCFLRCLHPSEEPVFGTLCHATRSMRSECSLQISGAFLSPPSLKSFPIRAIFPDQGAHLKGLISFNLEAPNRSQDLMSDEFNSHQKEDKDGWRIDIVHPKFCKVTKSPFRLPCSPKIEKNNLDNEVSNLVLFEPHWSIAIEY